MNPYKLKDINPLYCVCCDKEIKLLYESDANKKSILGYPSLKNNMDERESSKYSSEMWNDGVVQEISAGYGSSHDGDVFLIAICDDCLSKKAKSGNAIFLGNYMGGYDDEADRKRLNGRLHRRMKLERILK